MTESLGETRVQDLARVERDLADLWRQAAEEDHAVVRACMLNLVIFTEPGEATDDATREVARFSEQYPARALLVSRSREAAAGEDGAGGLSAYVSAHCHRGPGGRQVCSEQITLEVPAASSDLVEGSLLRLLVGDCPTYTWWRARRLAPGPLLGAAVRLSDRFVVDSAACEDAGEAMASLAGIATSATWRGHAGDLSWEKLEPWREHLASLFDPPTVRDYVSQVRSARVSVAGAQAPRRARVCGAYLLGWLASRLGWSPGEQTSLWSRPDGTTVRVELTESDEPGVSGIVAVVLECEREGERAVFEARRIGDGTVRLSVDVGQGCPLPFVRRSERRDDVTLLLDLLRRRSDDPVFAGALSAAVRLLGREPRMPDNEADP